MTAQARVVEQQQQRPKRLSIGRRGDEGIKAVQRLAERIQTTISSSPVGVILNGRLTPRVGVEEAEGEMRVTAEVPGLDRDRLEVILLRANVLRIKTIEPEEARPSDDAHARAHRGFERLIRLRCDVDHTGAQAILRNGVLTVRLPKSQPVEAVPRSIRVMAP